MSANRDTYLEATGLALPPGHSDEQAEERFREARCAALERAHEIRKFEIELYWKRANYFWLLQAAVFAAVGLTWRNTGSGVPPAVPVLLSALGVVTAWAGYLSALGSKFWQENWEHHIDMLEDEFEGRLHKTAYVGPRGIQWSVSGINERLSLCFSIFWFLVLIGASLAANPHLNLKPCHWVPTAMTFTEAATILSWLGVLIGIGFLYGRPTEMRGDKVYYPETGRGARIQEGFPRVRMSAGSEPFLAKRQPRI